MNEINLQLILPLIGVAIGWLLNETGYLFRARRENKKVIGKLINELYQLRKVFRHYQTLMHAAKHFNANGQLTEKDRNFLTSMQIEYGQGSSEDKIMQLLPEIAAVDPLLALEFGRKLSGTADFKRILEGTYLQSSSMYRMGTLGLDIHQPFIDDLKTIILKLSRKVGWVTWIRAKRYFSNERQDVHAFGDAIKSMRENAGVENIQDLDKFFEWFINSPDVKPDALPDDLRHPQRHDTTNR